MHSLQCLHASAVQEHKDMQQPGCMQRRVCPTSRVSFSRCSLIQRCLELSELFGLLLQGYGVLGLEVGLLLKHSAVVLFSAVCQLPCSVLELQLCAVPIALHYQYIL